MHELLHFVIAMILQNKAKYLSFHVVAESVMILHNQITNRLTRFDLYNYEIMCYICVIT